METKEYYGGTYPNPPEPKEKHIKVKVHITQEAEYDVPENWNEEDIKKDINDNMNYIMWNDIEIEELEVN